MKQFVSVGKRRAVFCGAILALLALALAILPIQAGLRNGAGLLLVNRLSASQDEESQIASWLASLSLEGFDATTQSMLTRLAAATGQATPTVAQVMSLCPGAAAPAHCIWLWQNQRMWVPFADYLLSLLPESSFASNGWKPADRVRAGGVFLRAAEVLLSDSTQPELARSYLDGAFQILRGQAVPFDQGNLTAQVEQGRWNAAISEAQRGFSDGVLDAADYTLLLARYYTRAASEAGLRRALQERVCDRTKLGLLVELELAGFFQTQTQLAELVSNCTAVTGVAEGLFWNWLRERSGFGAVIAVSPLPRDLFLDSASSSSDCVRWEDRSVRIQAFPSLLPEGTAAAIAIQDCLPSRNPETQLHVGVNLVRNGAFDWTVGGERTPIPGWYATSRAADLCYQLTASANGMGQALRLCATGDTTTAYVSLLPDLAVGQPYLVAATGSVLRAASGGGVVSVSWSDGEKRRSAPLFVGSAPSPLQQYARIFVPESIQRESQISLSSSGDSETVFDNIVVLPLLHANGNEVE